jgi:hypothetical protein
MAEKADVSGDNDVFDTLTLLTVLTLSRLEVVGASERRCAVLGAVLGSGAHRKGAGTSHGGPHWDVVDPKTKKHINVRPGQHIDDVR